MPRFLFLTTFQGFPGQAQACTLPLSLQSPPLDSWVPSSIVRAQERYLPPPKCTCFTMLSQATAGCLATLLNFGFFLCAHKTGRLPATRLQFQGRGTRPQENLFIQREKISKPFGLIPPHRFHSCFALQKPSRGSSIPQTFLKTCSVQHLVGAVAGEAVGPSPPETYRLAGKT